MRNQKIYIISESLDIRSMFKDALADFPGVEITSLESVYPVVKLLECSHATPFVARPAVIIVDLSAGDFREPHIRDEFSGLSSDVVVLAILPSTMSKVEMHAYLDHSRSFDVLLPPFSALEIKIRLRAVFAYAECKGREQFFERALKGMGGGVLIIDTNETILWHNPEAAKLLGYEASPLLSKPLTVLIRDYAGGNHNIQPGKKSPFKIQMIRHDGSDFWANCAAGNVHLSGRSGFMLVFTDASAEKEREDELLLSAKVFEFSGEAIMITDAEDKILAVNEAFQGMTGYPTDEVVGRCPDFLNSGRQDSLFYEKMWEGVHQNGHWTGEVWNRLKNGRIRPMWMAVTAVENSAGEIDHYVTILSDITDRLVEEKHLWHLAQHDFLTGLPNRVLLKDRFAQAAAGANRNGWKIALLFLDLDKFKDINDRNGHTVGDQLLQQVAERLLACLRSSDTACRWGGDEFLLLFPGITKPECISNIFDKISVSLRQPFRINGDVYRISASIGIGLYPEDGTDIDALLAHADAAMYSAKKNGSDSSIKPPR